MPGLSHKKYNGMIKAIKADDFEFWIQQYHFIVRKPTYNAMIIKHKKLRLLIPRMLNIHFHDKDIGDYKSIVTQLYISIYGHDFSQEKINSQVLQHSLWGTLV